MALVSVVVTTRGDGSELPALLHALLRQHEVGLEVLVVGTSAQAPLAVPEPMAGDPRVTCLVADGAGTRGAARNHGIEAAHGEWLAFCDALDLPELKADPALARNNQRVAARPTLMPLLRGRLATRSATELADRMERAGLPFAPIRKPEDLFDDPHLLATGGLADVVLSDGERAGTTVKTTLLPITLAGERMGVRLDPPKRGADTETLLRAVGYDDAGIAALRAAGAIG